MPSQHVILIHGLWMNGWDMLSMQHRFRKSAYSTSRFKYSSVNSSPAENAQQLSRLVNDLKAEQIHFICHSLGGLVLRQYLDQFSLDKPGRVVMLGVPNNTSQAARTLINWPGGENMLGKSTENGLLGPLPEWRARQSLGVIAGTLRMGLGMLIPNMPKPNDGTVSVAETRLTGMQDHIALPVSHFGLLISRRVFKQVRHFIENGCFIHD